MHHVLVPVKGFADAKVRLAGALPPADRARLARDMAANVLAAAAPLPVAVVCDDEAVATWAAAAGATVLFRPGLGLNGAVTDGVAHLWHEGATRVVIAHADLPFATSLAPFAEFDGVTLVPDRHGDGTNVVCVPAGCGFTFAYGPGSFGRHLAEAKRLGVAHRVVRDRRLGWDVDVPDDLEFPADLLASGACS